MICRQCFLIHMGLAGDCGPIIPCSISCPGQQASLFCMAKEKRVKWLLGPLSALFVWGISSGYQGPGYPRFVSSPAHSPRHFSSIATGKEVTELPLVRSLKSQPFNYLSASEAGNNFPKPSGSWGLWLRGPNTPQAIE